MLLPLLLTCCPSARFFTISVYVQRLKKSTGKYAAGLRLPSEPGRLEAGNNLSAGCRMPA